MKLELIKDWMSFDVITVSPDMSLSDAYQLMTKNKIRRLPVMENGRLIGILTLGDIRGAKPSDVGTLSLWEINFMTAQLTIADIMTRNPTTITSDENIAHAAQIMLEKTIGCLPVLDTKDNLIGIITESDIFRFVVHNWVHNKDDPPEPFAHYGNR